jgi:hypothetical protein
MGVGVLRGPEGCVAVDGKVEAAVVGYWDGDAVGCVRLGVANGALEEAESAFGRGGRELAEERRGEGEVGAGVTSHVGKGAEELTVGGGSTGKEHRGSVDVVADTTRERLARGGAGGDDEGLHVAALGVGDAGGRDEVVDAHKAVEGLKVATAEVVADGRSKLVDAGPPQKQIVDVLGKNAVEDAGRSVMQPDAVHRRGAPPDTTEGGV